jgi:hypothetical protein
MGRFDYNGEEIMKADLTKIAEHCPFCETSQHLYFVHNPMTDLWRVQCGNCIMRGESGDTADDALRSWQTAFVPIKLANDRAEILDVCFDAIAEAIYSEDGLDGAKGVEILEMIKKSIGESASVKMWEAKDGYELG